MAKRAKDDMSRAILGACDKLKAKEKPIPLLEQIMKTYLTDDLMDAFNIKEKKRNYLKKLLAVEAKETGNKESKKSVVPLGPTIPVLNIAHNIMRENAEKCPTDHMDRFFEQDVRNMIQGKHLEKKYPKIIDSMIVEIREIFIDMTHNAGVNLKVKQPYAFVTRFRPEPYKYMGKTGRYDIFLKHREELKSKWVLYYPLIKKIQQECVDRLPQKILDISGFHYPGLFELSELAVKFNDLALTAEMILIRLRDKVVSLIDKDKTKVQKQHIKHYYEAITTLQAIHVSSCIIRTLEYIIEVSGSRRRVPFLVLTIHFEGALVLRPSSAETSFIYRNFMNQLVEIGSNFQTIEKRGKKIVEKNIHLNVTRDYFEEAAARMKLNIKSLYEPVINYVQKLDDLFRDIYRDIDREGTVSVEQPEMTFEIGCNLIRHYENYFVKASKLQCGENFAIGQLVLSEYVKTLRESLSMVIEDIFLKLCNIHLNENDNICAAFEEVRRKALKKPVTTEELIEQGKYMIEVKTVILNDLKERIQTLLSSLTKMIDYGTLSKDHMALNAKAVQWLVDIEDVLEQNSAMYEGIKYEAEEKVHRSIAEIKKRNADLIPKLIILNEMDNIKNSRQYIMQMAPIMEELREIKTKIIWTNREEACLGFALSEYPEYGALLAFIHPFYHLVKLCLNLIRKTTVWLDGQFEFLNYEETEMFIEDYNKEFLKTFKLYKTKIRQAHQEKSPLTFMGISDDVDSSNWPSPLKLCNQATQLIKKFRPAMTMMRIMCNDALLKRHWKGIYR
ncbi:hypothetical protein HHI36_000795 [Cryptolaemus montrouzieri]|uniref:Dynein heavy chain linker domain-containing protein n=1 Tax=Cryptolaemus montrouzieri TaxID=559131 RepID=A0ABD2P698_9CUCU